MSCKYNEVKLGDVCIFGDGAHTKVNRVENGIPYLTSKNIKNGYIDLQNVDYITNEDYIKLFGESQKSVRHLQEGDVLIGIIGTFGNCYLYKDNDKFGISSSIAIARPNKDLVNPKFLYYYLSSDRFKKYTDMYKGGSVQGYTNLPTLRKIPMYLPPLEKQEKIADILSSLDDKIELNNEMNKTLEEMAQSIFKRWFVDFEFPNEDGEPYKSSGGEMIDSELGMIPKGWEVKCIYDLAEYINGTSFKAKDYSEKGLPIIKIAELKNGITDGTKFFSGEKDKKFYLKNGDILFSWSGNPDTSIDTFIWDKGDAILNQHIFKVIPKFDKGYAFTYLMLKYLKSTFTHIARNKQTTGLGHVTVKDLKELKIALCFSKIKEFNEVAEPMVDLIFENNMSIEQLNKIRDSLLPKLMSGEIKV